MFSRRRRYQTSQPRVAAYVCPGDKSCIPLSAAQAGIRIGYLTLVYLVEGAAVGKVLFLRFRPAAKHVIDGEQLQFRELIRVFFAISGSRGR